MLFLHVPVIFDLGDSQVTMTSDQVLTTNKGIFSYCFLSTSCCFVSNVKSAWSLTSDLSVMWLCCALYTPTHNTQITQWFKVASTRNGETKGAQSAEVATTPLHPTHRASEFESPGVSYTQCATSLGVSGLLVWLTERPHHGPCWAQR